MRSYIVPSHMVIVIASTLRFAPPHSRRNVGADASIARLACAPGIIVSVSNATVPTISQVAEQFIADTVA